MSDDFGKELQAAHREQMWKIWGWLAPLGLLALGAAVTIPLYVRLTYGERPCDTCLESVSSSWDCGASPEVELCGEGHAKALNTCLRFCHQLDGGDFDTYQGSETGMEGTHPHRAPPRKKRKKPAKTKRTK